MVLCKLACSLVTRVRKSIRADRGHFQQIAWAVNCVTAVSINTECNSLLFNLFSFCKYTCCLVTMCKGWFDLELSLGSEPAVLALCLVTPCVYLRHWRMWNCLCPKSYLKGGGVCIGEPWAMVWFAARVQYLYFSLYQRVETISGVHPVSCWLDTSGNFPRSLGVEQREAWS
jgi:hypothetical protein